MNQVERDIETMEWRQEKGINTDLIFRTSLLRTLGGIHDRLVEVRDALEDANHIENPYAYCPARERHKEER